MNSNHVNYKKRRLVSGLSLTAETRLLSQRSSYGICGGQSGTETGSSPSNSVFYCQL